MIYKQKKLFSYKKEKAFLYETKFKRRNIQKMGTNFR